MQAWIDAQRFGKEEPGIIQTIEEKVRRDAEKKAIRHQAKLLRHTNEADDAKESDSNAHS